MSHNPDTIRVILADDHTVVRAGIRQILEHAGEIQVIAEAENGLDAETLIQDLKPDVAVLDIQMPKASGIEVTRWVRAHLSGVGVLILTAFDDDPYVLAALQAGANGYMLKTAEPEDLIRAVRDVNEGKSALSAGIAGKLVGALQSNSGSSGKSSPVENLSDREMEVLGLVAKGYTNKAIATQLQISDRTVQGHLARIFAKLQAASRTEAVMRAVAMGWIASDVGQITNE